MPRQEGLVAGRCGQRAGLDLQVAPSLSGGRQRYQGPPSWGSGGCNTGDQPKADRTKSRGYFPLPTSQTGCGRLGQVD